VSHHIDNSQIELIEHEINGYISNDKKAIYQWIQQLQYDHNYCDIIAHRNKEKVKQYYDIEKVSAIVYDLIYHHTHSDQLSSQSIYEQALHKISHNNRYKYDEPMSIIILKKIYTIVRVIMRKI
jgi:hypothetical protein